MKNKDDIQKRSCYLRLPEYIAGCISSISLQRKTSGYIFILVFFAFKILILEKILIDICFCIGSDVFKICWCRVVKKIEYNCVCFSKITTNLFRKSNCDNFLFQHLYRVEGELGTKLKLLNYLDWKLSAQTRKYKIDLYMNLKKYPKYPLKKYPKYLMRLSLQFMKHKFVPVFQLQNVETLKTRQRRASLIRLPTYHSSLDIINTYLIIYFCENYTYSLAYSLLSPPWQTCLVE